jgi:hypothetical protein
MMPIKIECECGQKYAFDVEPTNGRMPSKVACPVCGADGTFAANETIARQMSANPDPIRLVSLPSSAAAMPSLPPALVATMPTTPPPLPPVSTAPPPMVATAASPGPVRLATEPMPAATSPQPVRLAASANPIHLAQPASAPTASPAPSRRPDPRLGQVDREQAKHEARAKAMWGDSRDQITGYLLGQGFAYPEAMEITEEVFKERTAAVRANGIRKIITGFGMVCLPVIAFIIMLAIHLFILYVFAAAVLAGVYGLWQLFNGILMALSPKSDKTDVADQ